jgi:large subunit ribosomal protein L24
MARRKFKQYDVPLTMPIRKGDIVEVLIGKDARHEDVPAKQGRVLRTFPRTGLLIVEGVNMRQRHTRPNAQQGIRGGVIEKEGVIHVSNVKLVRREQREKPQRATQEAGE